MQTYKAKDFNLSGLNGISDQTLEMHFKLYQGYVTNTNTYNEKIWDLVKGGSLDAAQTAVYSELKRRLGWEYNGMVLHELYFGNMKKQGGGDADKSSAFRKAIEEQFSGYDVWKNDFVSAGKMRGIGWVLTLRDPQNGALSNHWVTEHEQGNVAGFDPILVMDVWEHAYLLDYKPAERAKYIEAFFSNIDWSAIDGRVSGKVRR